MLSRHDVTERAMNRSVGNEALEIPRAPKRVFTASDWLMVLGAPVILYVGGLGAAGGSMGGLILVGFAGLVVVTLQIVREGRRNEPRMSKWTRYGAIGVSVFGFVWSWDLFHRPVEAGMWQYVWPAAPVVVYLIFVAALFAPRAVR